MGAAHDNDDAVQWPMHRRLRLDVAAATVARCTKLPSLQGGAKHATGRKPSRLLASIGITRCNVIHK